MRLKRKNNHAWCPSRLTALPNLKENLFRLGIVVIDTVDPFLRRLLLYVSITDCSVRISFSLRAQLRSLQFSLPHCLPPRILALSWRRLHLLTTAAQLCPFLQQQYLQQMQTDFSALIFLSMRERLLRLYVKRPLHIIMHELSLWNILVKWKLPGNSKLPTIFW